MLPVFSRRNDPNISVSVSEARFTQQDVRLHKILVEISANQQHYISRACASTPVDPVSFRHKCCWRDARLNIPLVPWEGLPVIKVAFWDRSRGRKTCIGSVDVPVAKILENLDSSGKFCPTLQISSTLFPTLNIKAELQFGSDASAEAIESWKTLMDENQLLVPEEPFSDEEEHDSDTKTISTLGSTQSTAYLTPPPHAAEQNGNLTPSLGRTHSKLSLASKFSGRSGRSGQTEKSRRFRRRYKKNTFAVDVESSLQGILYLEIVGARNLPRFRTLTGFSFDMDPFVVISFGQRTFKTPYRRHTTNPTFNQKLILLVDKHEMNYDIKFTIWDKDKITLNDRVAQGTYRMHEAMERKPRLNPNGLFALDDFSHDSLVIPLETFDAAKARTSRRSDPQQTPELLVNMHYLPFAAVRQQLWRGIIQMYDLNDSGRLGPDELMKMLGSLGSTLDRHTIDGYFDGSPTISTDECVKKIEEQLEADQESEVSDETSSVFNNRATARVISLRVCPVCQKPRLGNFSEMQSMRHISFCASQQWSGTDAVLLDDRYVTHEQASRRWYTRFLSKFWFGSYHLGANNANILVQDRISGQITEEKMSTYVRLGIRVLYAAGPLETRKLQKVLKKYTIKQGIKYDSPSSATQIEPFIRFHHLDMADVLLPVDKFSTFNEFFYRQLKPGARPCENENEPRTAVSLADCRLSLFDTINEATQIWIKGKSFSIAKLIGNTYPGDVDRYKDGGLVIFRLAPQDYHRFHIPVDGVLGKAVHIPGQYYTVNPMAIRSPLDVYGANARTVVPIDSPQFGRVMIVLVGAMMVGSIVITAKEGQRVKRTDELGYFKFGGSTAVVLFEKDKVVFDSDLRSNSQRAIETLVRVGMSIGHTKDIPEYTRVYDTRKATIKRAETTITGGGSYMPFSLD